MPRLGDNLCTLFPCDAASAKSFVACVVAAGEVQARFRETCRDVVVAANLTPHERAVCAALRAKHGMTQDQALSAVLRSRGSLPNAGEG